MASVAKSSTVGMATASASRAKSADMGFPGNVIEGSCMIVAPLLLIIGSLLAVDIYHAKGADYIQAMADHHTRAALTINLAVAGITLLTFAVIGLARAISAVRPGLGRAGGIITIVGLFGPLFFNGIYFAGFQLAGTSSSAAGATMMDQAQVIPSNVMNIAGPALVIGFILLALGAAKAGVLSRGRALALGVCCIMPVGFISGFIVISTVAFLGAAIALVPLGYRMVQRSGSLPAI